MKYLLIVSVLLSGCASRQVEIVPQPEDNNSVVKEYDVYPTFKGFELVVGIPALKSIPIIGFLFGEIINIRAGTNQDVLVPIMAPKNVNGVPMGAPQDSPPKRVDRSKARWSQYR